MSPGCISPRGLPLIPPLRSREELFETCFPHVLLIAPAEVTVLLLASIGTSVKSLQDAAFGLGNFEVLQNDNLWPGHNIPVALVVGGIGSPKIHVHLQPQTVTLFRGRVFADIIRHNRKSPDVIILDLGCALKPMVCLCEKRGCRDTGN